MVNLDFSGNNSFKQHPDIAKSPVNYTESKLVDKNLASHIELATALDQLPYGMQIIDTEYNISFVNQAFTELAGTTQKKATASKCWQVLSGPFCHTPECSLRRILNGENSVQAEVDRVRNDGTVIKCMISAFPLYDRESNTVGIIESFRDISRREKLQSKLHEAEDLYRAMIELSREVGESIIMVQDLNGREGVITFATDQFSQLSGYFKEELYSKAIFDLIHSADRKTSLSRHRRKMKGESMPGLYEIDVIRKDGSAVPCELTSAVTTYEGKPANVIYLRDISQRKEMERELIRERDLSRKYLDVANVMMVVLDRNQEVSLINKKGCRVLGCDQKRIIGKKWTEVFIPEEHREEVLDVFNKVMSGQVKPVEYHENPVLTKSGERRIIAWHNALLKDDNGVIIGALGSGIDITELRETESKLHQHQKHLEELVAKRTEQLTSEVNHRQDAEQKLKQALKLEKKLYKELETHIKQRIKFTRALVHELKTPLMPMLGAGEVLAQELNDEPYSSLAKVMHQGGCQLDKRIDELLDIAKGEIGILKLNLSTFNPLKLLEKVTANMHAHSKRYGHSVDIDVPLEMKIIRADYERLDQVLLNLINNAFKFTPENGRIAIKAYQDDTCTIFEIKDNGIGISKTLKNKLTMSHEILLGEGSSFSGLGLGLALSKMLVEMHSGKLDIYSKINEGTRVVVKIPFKQAKTKTSVKQLRAKIDAHTAY